MLPPEVTAVPPPKFLSEPMNQLSGGLSRKRRRPFYQPETSPRTHPFLPPIPCSPLTPRHGSTMPGTISAPSATSNYLTIHSQSQLLNDPSPMSQAPRPQSQPPYSEQIPQPLPSRMSSKPMTVPGQLTPWVATGGVSGGGGGGGETTNWCTKLMNFATSLNMTTAYEAFHAETRQGKLWMVKCFLDDEEYGERADRSSKRAKQDAARQAYEKLSSRDSEVRGRR
ncbi:hypothetical protein DL96DRAFT_490318 [Flagelloscypha sp. PMI_526]|nr:hypothetical protein DL96DRAFT_490318 [Flagelloscypha sp. PMI_526]